jgi:hypothetical protein
MALDDFVNVFAVDVGVPDGFGIDDDDGPVLTQDLAHSAPFAGAAWASNTELWVFGTDGVAVKKTLALP